MDLSLYSYLSEFYEIYYKLWYMNQYSNHSYKKKTLHWLRKEFRSGLFPCVSLFEEPQIGVVHQTPFYQKHSLSISKVVVIIGKMFNVQGRIRKFEEPRTKKFTYLTSAILDKTTLLIYLRHIHLTGCFVEPFINKCLQSEGEQLKGWRQKEERRSTGFLWTLITVSKQPSLTTRMTLESFPFFIGYQRNT